MKKIVLFLLLLIPVLFLTCKKNDNGPVSPTTPPSGGTPERTPVGIPVGSPTTVRIGPAGGTAASADGRMTVTIPAGVLPGDTPISVQPITNNAPGGLGTAYRLGPAGMHFSSPITLRFSYANDTIQVPELTGVAYQDTDGIWYAPPDYSVDSLTQTVSASVSHFSDWTDFEEVNIYPVRATLWTNQTLALELRESIMAGRDGQPQPIYRVTDNQVTWGASAGSISASSDPTCDCSPATYRAPGSIPAGNPVRVSASVSRRFTYHGTIVPTNRTVFFSYVTITDSSARYHVELYYKNPQYYISFIQFTLSDTCGFDVTVVRRNVTVGNITNHSPSVAPPETTMNECTLTWLPGGPGPVNIRTVTGELDTAQNVDLQFYQPTFTEQFHWSACNGSPPATFGGDPSYGDPGDMRFPISIVASRRVDVIPHVYAIVERTQP